MLNSARNTYEKKMKLEEEKKAIDEIKKHMELDKQQKYKLLMN